MCPFSNEAARPPHQGLAGQGIFFTIKERLSNRRGGVPTGAATFIVFGGMGASAPVFVILLNICVTHSKQRRALFKDSLHWQGSSFFLIAWQSKESVLMMSFLAEPEKIPSGSLLSGKKENG